MSPTSRHRLAPVDVPPTADAADAVLPAVAAALSGAGPAVLPVPAAGQPAVRDAVLAALRPDEPLESDDVALVVPTSGSTGEPKGVLLTRDALRASAEATDARIGGPGRWLLALPATHVAGLMVLVRSVVAGTTPVAVDLSGGFDPAAFAIAARPLVDGPDRAYVSLVPRQLQALVEAGGPVLEALAGFDAVVVGGASTDSDLALRVRAAGVALITTYGMTETCGGCVYDGRPLDGVVVRTGDDGRIRIAGPTIASGYRLRPDLSSAFVPDLSGRWFVTADLGEVDADGTVHVHGRADDVAISGGVNVPLAAVDRAVVSHPGVAEAVAAAVPDAAWGQRIVVGVVATDPRRPPTLASVRDHVIGVAPVAYAPKEIVVIASVPLVPGGKPDRRAIAAAVTATGETAR